jgi:hypothetical protein
MSQTKIRKNAKNLRCVQSGKLTQNREVVITDYAIDYVEKQGCVVIRNPFKKQKNDIILK